MLLMYPMEKALRIHPWSCKLHPNWELIWIMAMGIMTRSALFMKFAIEHSPIIFAFFVNLAIMAIWRFKWMFA